MASLPAANDHGGIHGNEKSGEKLAACALSIGVGSYSDQRNIQGLAHFLEHMIFMGSEKYPTENEYDAYIQKCGGFDNAATGRYTIEDLKLFSKFFCPFFIASFDQTKFYVSLKRSFSFCKRCLIRSDCTLIYIGYPPGVSYRDG